MAGQGLEKWRASRKRRFRAWRRSPRLRRLVGAGFVTLVLVTVAGIVGWSGFRAAVGQPDGRLDEPWHRGHRIVDRSGTPLRELTSHLGQRGRPMPLEGMGDRLVVATLVSEDKDFYQHSGVDLGAIVRAMSQNARHVRIVSGASTVTQQLVKLLDHGGEPPRDRSVTDKLHEAARAQNLEAVMTKRQILEAYLNRLSYGRGCVGPGAAATAMFGVSPGDLSWAQAALLAVLPRAPSYLDPYDHPQRALVRQRALLDALRGQGWLTRADHARALAEPIDLRPIRHPFRAPHLTEALRLVALGERGQLAAGDVTTTTIDLALQQDVEGLVKSHRARLAGRRGDNAAVLVVDNATGEVLAYVGSADFDDVTIAGQVDMVRARRQPGSTLKPFVYALAFQRGLQPSDLVADVATRFGERSGAYAPDNFDGSFQGPISAREALAGSLNVPAVRLGAELEPGELLSLLRSLGMTSLDREAEHYGLSLALGSGEVSLQELAEAYVALARGGDRIALRYTVADPTTLGRPVPPGEPIIAPAAAAAVSDSLSDPLARVRGLGGPGPFDLGYPVAVKTGTSSGYRDTWTVGYTRERTVAVWVGNADGRPTDQLTGGRGAGPLFADVMARSMGDVASRRPLWEPSLLSTMRVCPLSGKPVSPACPEAVERRLIGDDGHRHAAGGVCALHRRATRRPAPAGEVPWRCDEAGAHTIVVLPKAFDGWLASQPSGAPGHDLRGLGWYAATALPSCQAGQPKRPELRIDEPAPGTVLLLSRSSAAAAQRVELAASLVGGTVEQRRAPVEFVLDGAVVARSEAPYRAHVAIAPGDHTLEVRPTDPRLAIGLGASRFAVR